MSAAARGLAKKTKSSIQLSQKDHSRPLVQVDFGEKDIDRK